MTQPLLQPAILVSENCPECQGTGEDRKSPVPHHPCDRCEGSGREVREVPMSEAFEMLREQHLRITEPPPSELRARALADT